MTSTEGTTTERDSVTTFPLTSELYGDLRRFEDAGLLTADALARHTTANPVDADITEFGECPRCYFQTSGTSGEAKRIPYSADDLERQIDHEARSFAVGGLTADDVVLSLASPPPSLSAWATEQGSRRLGAAVVNTSYVDFDVPVDDGRGPSATFVFGTPLMLQMIGEMCDETWGSAAAAFPNVARGILYGDVLPAPLEQRLKQHWGIEHCFLYGSVEADVIAMSCSRSRGALHVMDKVIVELIPEAALAHGRQPDRDDLVPVERCPDGTRGEIVVSDLERDHLPLIRYRTGDMAEVRHLSCPCGRSGPTLSILGRLKNVIPLDGRLTHEMEIHRAVEAALPGRWDDWSLTVTRDGSRAAGLDLAVMAPGDLATADLDAVAAALAGLGCGPDVLDVSSAAGYVPQGLVGTGDVKANRIVFA